MKRKVFDKKYFMQLSEILREAWQKAPEIEPDFLEECSGAAWEENENRISRMMEQGKNRLGEYPQSFFAIHKRKKWKRRIEKLLQELLWEEPLLNIGGIMGEKEFRDFQTCMKEFLRNVRRFDKSLALEDMGQAVRNYMVYAIFLALNGKELRYRPAAFGYSMLYPYTDNYIDSSDRTEQEKERYNRLIEDKLKGKKVAPLSRHARKTAKLLEQVEIDYGRPHEVYAGLLLMLEAQEKSLRQEEKMKQERGSLDLLQMEDMEPSKSWQQTDWTALADEISVLEVSIYKGGISVLMDRYFIDKPFTDRDIYFYYGFGFLLQLCDDLQDIAQDKQEGNPTVFSLCRTKEETSVKVNKLLYFTKELFEFCDTKNHEFKLFLQRNCYLLILASAAGSGEWMEMEWLERMERWLPVRLKYLRSFESGIFGGKVTGKKADEEEKEGSKAVKKKYRKFMRMLDELIAD